MLSQEHTSLAAASSALAGTASALAASMSTLATLAGTIAAASTALTASILAPPSADRAVALASATSSSRAALTSALVSIVSTVNGAAHVADDLQRALEAGPRQYSVERPLTVVRESAFKWVAGESERLALLPIRHDDLWAQRDTLKGLHWNAQEVVLTRDKKDWVTRMSDAQRQFVSMQLAFFSRIDIDALKYIEGLSAEVDCLEGQMYYCSQAEQECTHAESYGLQITAIADGAEQERLLNAARTMPIVSQIRDWVIRWFNSSIPIEERLVAFSAVEGVLFSASFCALQWLREKNLLPGITKFNEFIARDEGIHADTSCLLVRKYLRVKPDEKIAHGIFREVVETIIDPFVSESLPVALLGINANLMMQYVRYQADCVMTDMEYAPIYRVTNPFNFMHKLTMNDANKNNFFETRGTDYQNITKSSQAEMRLDTSSADD